MLYYSLSNLKYCENIIVHAVPIVCGFHVFAKPKFDSEQKGSTLEFSNHELKNLRTDRFPLNHENWNPRIKVLPQ